MRRSSFAIVATLLSLAACSAPPEKERGQAEGAIAAARAASAEVYAADELLAAESALTRYDQAVAARDYREALNAALDARDRATEAVSRASTAKAEARGRAEQLAQALDALVQTASQRIAGTATPRITGAAATRLRRSVTTATTALQEARTAVADGQYLVAISTLEAATEALQKDLDNAGPRPRR